MAIKSPPSSGPTTAEIHEAWKLDFFENLRFSDVTEHSFLLSMKRLGNSTTDKKRIKFLNKFEVKLAKLCDQFGYKTEIKNGSYRMANGGGSVEKAFLTVFGEIQSERGLLEVTHDFRIKGQGRVVPSFIAKRILLGFALHERDKIGQSLMQDFLSNNPKGSGFYQWYQTEIRRLRERSAKNNYPEPSQEISGLTEVANVVCSSRAAKSTNITEWAKQQKIYFLDAVEFSVMKKSRERTGLKRNPKRRKDILAETEKLAAAFRLTLEKQ